MPIYSPEWEDPDRWKEGDIVIIVKGGLKGVIGRIERLEPEHNLILVRYDKKPSDVVWVNPEMLEIFNDAPDSKLEFERNPIYPPTWQPGFWNDGGKQWPVGTKVMVINEDLQEYGLEGVIDLVQESQSWPGIWQHRVNLTSYRPVFFTYSDLEPIL